MYERHRRTDRRTAPSTDDAGALDAPRVVASSVPAESLESPIGGVSEVAATDDARGEEVIRRRAYELYLARGAADGDDVADWLAAESELRPKNALGGPATAPSAEG